MGVVASGQCRNTGRSRPWIHILSALTQRFALCMLVLPREPPSPSVSESKATHRPMRGWPQEIIAKEVGQGLTQASPIRLAPTNKAHTKSQQDPWPQTSVLWAKGMPFPGLFSSNKGVSMIYTQIALVSLGGFVLPSRTKLLSQTTNKSH